MDPTPADRLFPNEIFDLIVSNFSNDPCSLRNLALVCRDLRFMAQSHIFRTLTVKTVYSSGRFRVSPVLLRFYHLIRNPETMHLRKLVHHIELNWGFADEEQLSATQFIFQSLPSISRLKIHGSARSEFVDAIKANLATNLNELWIKTTTFAKPEDLDSFQSMLSSMTCLKFLAVSFWCLLSSDPARDMNRALVLPDTLHAVSFMHPDNVFLRAIALGLECTPYPLPPPVVILEFWDPIRVNKSARDILWEAIGNNSLVVLDVEDGRISDETGEAVSLSLFYLIAYTDPSTSTDMISVTKGLKVRKLLFSCLNKRFNSLATFFTCLIPVLPEPVRQICIDFRLSTYHTCNTEDSSSDFQNELDAERWAKLDEVLVKRFEAGLLDSVQFRCTERIGSFGYSASLQSSGSGSTSRSIETKLDRRILGHIEGLLPTSCDLGIVEIDHYMMCFEPKM
ncbi:hypothetical protein D9757_003601 [Collybiopsis confluens]|uniref:F-box domain-containing protein n=1 Tax=Collybiopsis confluens TaxID=2823264 RepID=A0A8H5HV28_9AGAR|nr:hypothetical protein D9757_003601 [Collybiopsis confluens]